jgi:hypothetical protein
MSTPFVFLSTDEATLRNALAGGALDALRRETIADLDPCSLGRELSRSSGEALEVWLERMMAPPDDAGAPAEREIFWAVPDAMVTALARDPDTELGRVARRTRRNRETLYYALVDPKLLALVLDLYAVGHRTEAGCQGRSEEAEFRARRHDPAAYLSFASPIPESARASLAADGAVVYAAGRAVVALDIHCDGGERTGSIRGYRKVTETASAEDFRDDAIAAVVAANEVFVTRLRRAFGLAATSRHDGLVVTLDIPGATKV